MADQRIRILVADIDGRYPGDHEATIARGANDPTQIYYRCTCVNDSPLLMDPLYEIVYARALAHLSGSGGTIFDETGLHLDSSDPRRLARAAERAEAQPFYLAHAFRVWRSRHPKPHPSDRDRDPLADALGLAGRDYIARGDRLHRVALCRRPETRADAEAISTRFGLDADRLVGVVRSAGFDVGES